MNIGFDAKRAFLNNSGLGNYSRTLIKSMAHYYPKNKYELFTTKSEKCAFTKIAADIPSVSITEPESFLDKKFRARWRSYGITNLLKEKEIEVYHGLSNELPFNIAKFQGKKIVTIHDLIFLRYPKLYPYLDRKIYNKKFKSACDAADTIIAISAQTKKDIQEFYFIPEEKVKVVYQSCDQLFYKESGAAEDISIREKHKLPSEYILYVGTIEERKNLLTLVKALKDVKEIPLVVIGSKRKYLVEVMKYATEHKLEKRIMVISNAHSEELPAVYRGASVFVYPSFFEGFGIPIIEALTSKVPVISSKGYCFPETAGPDSIFFDPQNAKELAGNINKVLSSSSLAKEMTAKGFAYAKKFHPSVITTQLNKVYEST